MADTVRIQPYEDTWQTVGAGKYRGIEPAGLTATFNRNGPDTLNFDLDGIDQRLPALDVAEFTPIDLLGEDGQSPAWGGFIIDTPGRGKQGLGVSALGWQYHLDDDSSPVLYVYEGLDKFVDWRAIDVGPLSAAFNANGMADGQVSIGGDKIRLAWPNGTPIAATAFISVTLDLGPDLLANRIALTVAPAFNVTWKLYAIAHDAPDWRDGNSGPENAVNAMQTNAAPFTGAGVPYQLYRAVTQGHRYWTIVLYADSGTTLGADTWLDILQVQLFGAAAYGEALSDTGTNVPRSRSALTADVVFRTELAKCPLLSRDYSQIASVVYPIRALGGPDEEAAPRTMLERADSYHRYRWGIDAQRRGYFQPQPAVPALVVNTADPGVEYQDTSVNSGRDVYNKAIVVARSGAGKGLRRVRLSAPGPGRSSSNGVPQHANPDATVNTAGWTYTQLVGTAGTGITREVAAPLYSGASYFGIDVGLSNPAQGRVVGAVAGALPTGRLRLRIGLGTTYGVQNQYQMDKNVRWLRIAVRSTPSGRLYDSGRIADDGLGFANGGAWVERTLDFFHPADTGDTGYEIWVEFRGQIGDAYFDLPTLERVVATTPDKRGFPRSIRLDVAAASDPVAMDLLGDLKLALSSRPPFKGSLVVTGAVITDRLTGRRLTPLEAASRAGELIELGDVMDPVTGASGRIASIATGTYNRGVATLALDQDRASFEALQARMSG